MKLIHFVSVSLLIFLGISCKSYKEVEKKDSAFYVDVESINSTIDLRLSDIAEDLKLIPLETNEASIIGNCNYFINESYILAIDGIEGIYKFYADGKFKKKLLNVGRGPKEIPMLLKLESPPLQFKY